MNIEIRSATSTDIDGIQRVANRAWHSAHGPIIGAETVDEFLKEYYDTETFRSLIENDDSIFEVAADSHGDVAGFISAGPADEGSTTFNLGRIYVHPDRWSEGIGRRLLDHTEREIERCGGERIELGVMAENERAVNFYESAGYRREDESYDERIDTHSYTYIKAFEN